MDQRIDAYSTSTKSKRWTKKALSWLLDVCRVNAQIILAFVKGQDPKKTDSIQFSWKLAMALT